MDLSQVHIACNTKQDGPLRTREWLIVKDVVTLEKLRALEIYTRSKNIIHPLKTKINICYIKIQFATHTNSLLLQEQPIGECCIGQRWVSIVRVLQNV
jgi:hypothetical protein